MDAMALRANSSCGRTAPMRTTKACGPGLPTLRPSSRSDEVRGRREQESPVPGESALYAVKPSRGEGRMFGQTCGNCRLLFVLQAGHGRGQRPAFPAPSQDVEGDVFAKPGRDRAAGQQARISPLFDS
jgi:hypothetical protein